MAEPRARVRVIDLETAGMGACEVCEIGWQDVVLGEDGLWRLSEERGARFVNPGRPISPAKRTSPEKSATGSSPWDGSRNR